MNKILGIVLVLLLLNLAREYLWDKPENTDNLKINVPDSFIIEENKRPWVYYSDVFGGKENLNIGSKPLPLILRGTIIGSTDRSYAIIEDHGVQGLFGLGDMVSGAKVVAMNRDRVILDYNGTKQELMMSKVRPPSAIVQGPTLHNGMDFTRLMTQLRIKPYFEGGRCIGFQISNVNGSIKQMGLQDGDIVESINGVKVDDPLKAMQVLYSLERNNPVHLGIEREEEEIELDCRI